MSFLLLAVIQYIGMYVDTILPFFITYVSTFYIKFISTWTFFHSKHGQKGAFCQLPASPCPRSNCIEVSRSPLGRGAQCVNLKGNSAAPM